MNNLTVSMLMDWESLQYYKPEEVGLRINNQPVWDYKDKKVDNKRVLSLIHEPIEGSESFEVVTLKEIEPYKSLEIVSETVDAIINEVELLLEGEDKNFGVFVNLKTATE